MPYNHNLTSHSKTRMQQRSLNSKDMELLLKIASQISSNAYLLTRKDVDREVNKMKAEIRRLERLKGFKLIVENGTIITCYRSKKADQKRTFRRGRTGQ